MPYHEVYGALESGSIDAQVNPLWAVESMGFYEVSDYLTQMWAEPFIAIPVVNYQFFRNLPENQQDLIRDFFRTNITEAGLWAKKRNAQAREHIERTRRQVTWIEWDDARVEQARAMAREWEEEVFHEVAPPPAAKALNLLREDVKRSNRRWNE